MKLHLLLIVLMASTAHANLNVQDGKVSAELNGVPLQQVAQQLQDQIDVNLVLDPAVLSQAVSASFEGLPVSVAVRKILEGTGINFVVLGNEDGIPESIFIGKSERPGAPPRRLDSRPVNYPNRGVVAPVTPPPQPAPQMRRPEDKPPDVPASPLRPAVEVPTGGGYDPASSLPPKQQDTNIQDQNDDDAPEEE